MITASVEAMRRLEAGRAVNRSTVISKLKRVFTHPLVPVFVAGTLLLACLSEIVEPMLTGELRRDLASEHGLLLFAVAHGVKALLDLFGAVEEVGLGIRGAEQDDAKNRAVGN